MLKKSISKMNAFEAGDKTWLIEVLHPANDEVDTGFSLAHASLEAGESSLPHILNQCSETYYFLKGHGKIVVNQELETIKAGDIIFVPKGANQYVENDGTEQLEFLCIVSPAWYAEQEEIL